MLVIFNTWNFHSRLLSEFIAPRVFEPS